MSTKTLIGWTDATVNFWWGCTEVSPACTNCYAREWAKYSSRRLFGRLVEWGDGKPRAERLEAARKEALKLERLAIKEARRIRVFANSMSDWLDDQVPAAWLTFLLETIWMTPNLDWQLLTKRPANWRERLNQARLARLGGDASRTCESAEWMEDWIKGQEPPNVWIGVTAEDQPRAEARIPELLNIPAKVRFLSCEPLLGPLDLKAGCSWQLEADCGIHWVIAGGKSGHGTPQFTHPNWFRGLRDQCQQAGVAFFFKQWGDYIPVGTDAYHLPIKPYKATRWNDLTMLHAGKDATGNLLDGQTHEAFPDV